MDYDTWLAGGGYRFVDPPDVDGDEVPEFIVHDGVAFLTVTAIAGERWARINTDSRDDGVPRFGRYYLSDDEMAEVVDRATDARIWEAMP